MRYLFKRLDQQTTTTAHPQWAMGTHRSAPCLHLDGLVTHLDTLIFFEFPLLRENTVEWKQTARGGLAGAREPRWQCWAIWDVLSLLPRFV